MGEIGQCWYDKIAILAIYTTPVSIGSGMCKLEDSYMESRVAVFQRKKED
jgi:hypothetical protein